MSEQLLLSLTSWPGPDPHANSLSSLIPRIQNERGPFKNVSEEGLKEEITAAEKQQQDREEAQDEDARDSAQDDDDQANASTDEQPNPRETLAFKRQELIKLVEQAQFEAMYALDFVSLLLSNIRPVHAEASMSRHLRENVASGTLGAEPIRPKELAASLKDDNDTISKGWMSEALAQSASSLLSAASRLAQESEREATYWEDVLDVKKEGWAICRVPREPQSLGVRFGFWEAGADEKYRGLGILRKGSDGTITMQDLGYGTANHNSVRVRISRRGKITGISKPFADDSQTSGITSMIQTARNYAYEHELFLEIAREARALANLGFRNTDEAITFELGPGVSVVIDTINSADLSPEPSSTTDNHLAQGVSMALHLLLSHAHRQNLKRRRLPPAVLTHRPIASLPLVLLRPIASHLRHQDNANEFNLGAGKLCRYAESAALKSNITLEKCHNCFSKDIGNFDAAIDSLTGFLESKATIVFPGSWKVVVLIQTLLGPSIFGTRYVVQTAHDGSCATLMGNNIFSTQAEVQRYLRWCLERSIINHIQMCRHEWCQIAMSNEMAQKGEQSQYKRLRVEVEPDHLAIRWTIGSGPDQHHDWDGEERTTALGALLKVI